jgi:hypothetical protein
MRGSVAVWNICGKASGEGQATLEVERLIFELWYYLGDEWTFVCERRK